MRPIAQVEDGLQAPEQVQSQRLLLEQRLLTARLALWAQSPVLAQRSAQDAYVQAQKILNGQDHAQSRALAAIAKAALATQQSAAAGAAKPMP